MNITEVKDIIIIICTLLATYFAWKGLDTWRKTLLGTEKFRVGKELLISVLKVQRAYRKLTHPAIWEGEIAEAISKSNNDKNFKFEHTAVNKIVYDSRYEELKKTYIEMEGILLEAEVVLFLKKDNPIEEFKDIILEIDWLFGAFMHYMFSDPGSLTGEALEKVTAEMYRRPEAKLNAKIEDSVSSIKKYLKQHLK